MANVEQKGAEGEVSKTRSENEVEDRQTESGDEREYTDEEDRQDKRAGENGKRGLDGFFEKSGLVQSSRSLKTATCICAQLANVVLVRHEG